MLTEFLSLVTAAALVLRGTDAQLNFPNLASSLPRPLDLTDKSIQAAAIEAAQSFARQMRSHNRTHSFPTVPVSTSATQAAAHALHSPSSTANYNVASTCMSFTVETRDSPHSRVHYAPEDNVPPVTSNCEDFESRLPGVVTRVIDNSATSTPDYDVPEADMEPEKEDLGSPHPASSNFLEVDMMYNMAEAVPHHCTSIDSDEGASYAWEPRLWSF